MAVASIVAAAFYGLVICDSVTAAYSNNASDYPDCVCNTTWHHTEYKCKGIHKVIRGCPNLNELAVCENTPIQSWCETTEPICKQQITKELYSQNRVYCDARTQKPQLPKCTCKSSWFLNGNESGKTGALCLNKPMTVHGCPSEKKLRVCDPNFKEGDQPYCETNEEECFEQEDDANQNGEKMVGKGFAYCDRFDNVPVLPSCECKSQWTPPNAAFCSAFSTKTIFKGCPTAGEMKPCQPGTASDATQTKCVTTKNRCLQQTFTEIKKNGQDMVGNSWSFCNVGTKKPEFPECECQTEWQNNKQKCQDDPLNMKGCPSMSEMLKCESKTARSQSHCETTFNTCKQQNYESVGNGWSYCDAETDKAMTAKCECKAMWQNREDQCSDVYQQFRGCPSIEELQFCEPSITESWCKTMDETCLGQHGNLTGHGRVTCDPLTQMPDNIDNNVAEIVSTSVGVTMLICSLFILAGVLVYRRWDKNRRLGFIAMQEELTKQDAQL